MQKSRSELVQFKTWGIYPILLLPLPFFLILFAASIYVNHGVGVAVFGLLLLFLLLGSSAKIEVGNDGIVVKRILFFGTSYWSLDSVQFKAGGRVLAYGGMYGGWIIPFKRKELAKAIGIIKPEVPSIRKIPNKTLSYIYLFLPPTILLIIQKTVRYFELITPPLFWALLWGTTATLSVAVYQYKNPIKFKVYNLSRLGSSFILGFPIGLLVFLLLALLGVL